MRCPFCRSDNDRVIDTRTVHDGFAIRRRRECTDCERRYTTFEQVEEMVMKVVKKDGAREVFDREKIRAGLSKACWKRPISDEQIADTVAAIESEVYSDYEGEIDHKELGEVVMNRLELLDQVAYVRFASVYREFTTAHDFVEEIRPMLQRQNGQDE